MQPLAGVWKGTELLSPPKGRLGAPPQPKHSQGCREARAPVAHCQEGKLREMKHGRRTAGSSGARGPTRVSTPPIASILRRIRDADSLASSQRGAPRCPERCCRCRERQANTWPHTCWCQLLRNETTCNQRRIELNSLCNSETTLLVILGSPVLRGGPGTSYARRGRASAEALVASCSRCTSRSRSIR